MIDVGVSVILATCCLATHNIERNVHWNIIFDVHATPTSSPFGNECLQLHFMHA